MPSNEIEQVNRIDKTANVYTDSVVVTSENGKKQAVDFIDFIEKSTNPKAEKIKNLREYLSDEELLAAFQNINGIITTEEEIESSLEEIFFSLATYVTELPNGIVIDLATGLKDEDKSFEQAVNLGIYSEDSFTNSGETIMMNVIEDYGIKNINSDNELTNYIIEFSPQEYMSFNEIDDGVNRFLEKNEEDMNLSEDLKNEARDSKKIIEKSPYETDMHLFEITKLHIMLKETENTQNHNIVLSQIKKFYERYPNYIGKEIPVMNADGTLNTEEVAKLDEYSEAYEKMIMLEHFDMVNGLTEEELENLPESEKRHVMLCAFAGLRYEKNPNERTQAISKEARIMIEKFYPNLDLGNEKALAEFLKQEMGFKGTLEAVSLEELIESYSLQLKRATEKYIIDDLESYVDKDVNLSKVDLDSGGRRYVKDPMKNYFIGSKLKFSEADKNNYDELYRTFTVDAWIEKKDDAIKLRYQALHAVLEDYKKAKSNPYIEGKIEEIEKNISDFEKKYGKMDIKENDIEFDIFRQNFVNAGLTKYLTRDTLDWQDGKDYKDLDPTHKKGYMRNILVCLDYIKGIDKIDDVKFPISKLALRRLELMNSKGKEFITFDENGGFKINEDLILEEYRRLSPYKYTSFEELKYSAGLRKNEYLLTKLDEYTKLPESAFVEVEKDKPVEAIKTIDRVRTESNQVRINNIGKNNGKRSAKPVTPKKEETEKRKPEKTDTTRTLKQVISDNKRKIESSPYEIDMHLFEISKLHMMLKEAENTPNHNYVLSQIKKFYAKHPDYAGKDIPVKNRDGSLNTNEVAKLNEYSEAYENVIMLEHFDRLNEMTDGEIANISAAERKHVMLCAFAGLQYKKDPETDKQRISRESMKVIKRLYPSLDLNNNQQLAEFFKGEMGYKANTDSISLEEMIERTSLQLKQTVDKYLVTDVDAYTDKKIDFSRVDFNPGERKASDSKVEEKKRAISDSDFKKGISFATIGVDVIDVAEEKARNVVREIKTNDQTGIDDRTDNIYGELKSTGIGVAQIDASAINDFEDKKEDKKISFVDRLKSAFNTVKNFISKHISGKEEVKLLESGENKKVTDETKKMAEKTDFNSSISAGISLQEQQEYSRKQQMQVLTSEGKNGVEPEERV